MNSIIKKILMMLVVLSFLSVNSFAAPITMTDDAGEIDLFAVAHTSTDDAQSPVGLSPKVKAYYANVGTGTTDSQWYGISAVHPGGNRVFGTAQDVNNVYSQDHATGTDLDTSLTKIPASPASASDWSDKNWLL